MQALCLETPISALSVDKHRLVFLSLSSVMVRVCIDDPAVQSLNA